MATRKTTEKAGGQRRQSGGATSSRKRASSPHTGSIIPYGDPIRNAIARGEMQQMRKLAVTTRKWIKDVEKALGSLEKAIDKKMGK